MHIMGHSTLMKGMQQRLQMQVPGWRGFQLVMGQFAVSVQNGFSSLGIPNDDKILYRSHSVIKFNMTLNI